MSSPLSILSDWNGRVKKKSNDRVETTAATMPAVRPPSAAAIDHHDHEHQRDVGGDDAVGAERHEQA